MHRNHSIAFVKSNAREQIAKLAGGARLSPSADRSSRDGFLVACPSELARTARVCAPSPVRPDAVESPGIATRHLRFSSRSVNGRNGNGRRGLQWSSCRR